MMTMRELLVVVSYFIVVTFNAKQKLSVIHLSSWETCILPGVLHMKDGCMKISFEKRPAV